MSTPLSSLLVAGPALGTPSPLLAVKWDPNKRDYASLEEGADPIDAHVQHALCVRRGSGACVQDTGLEELPNKLLDSLDQLVYSAVSRALSRLLAAGDIKVLGVQPSARDDGQQFAEYTIRYVNLRTGRNDEQTVALPAAPVEV